MRICLDKSRYAASSAILASLILFSLCCFSSASRTSAALGNSHASVANAFAIADLDGDRKPDIATVEIQKASGDSRMQYSIRFKLTAGAAQSFGLIAPAGGLQIAARDVNGDSFLDLLISTVWQHRQIAVLLNDGHGNFRLADAGSFPAAQDSETRFDAENTAACDNVALLRSQSAGDASEDETGLGWVPNQSSFVQKAFFHGVSHLVLFSRSGRAPPTVTHRA